jgi:ABC-type transporter Mla subunit MlaD
MTTWGAQLNTLEQRATEHEQFATALISQLADPVKTLATRTEELRKLHSDYAAKLEKERDGQYAELRKTKGKYDSVCQEVESRRKKVDGAFDHGKNKARNAFEQQQVEMRNVKNTYLITINVTNKQKEMYYHEYVPELLDVGLSSFTHELRTNIGDRACKIYQKPASISSMQSGPLQHQSRRKPLPAAQSTCNTFPPRSLATTLSLTP